MTAAPLCPECAAGKPTNCAREALDPATDEFVPCATQVTEGRRGLAEPVQFADQVTVPRVILEESAVSPFDVIREIQRRAAVIERPVTYPRHVTPPGHPPHRFEVLPLSRIETLALPEQPRGRAGRKARRACRKRGGHFWHPADAMIEWGCCVCGHRRDGMPKDGT